MDYEKIDIKMKKVWRLSKALDLTVILIIIVAAWLLIKNLATPIEQGSILPWFYGISASLVLWRLISIFIFTEIEYRQWGYKIHNEKIDIHHGIFFTTHSIIPVIRIQHVTVIQGPIYRRFGLYGVKISLASGEFKILGLKENLAKEISDNLNARLYERLEALEERESSKEVTL